MKGIIIIFLCAAISCGAQSIDREVISTGGDSYANGVAEVSFTLGETIIATGSGGTAEVTQGFHQTKLFVTGVDESLSDLGIRVFPNPTAETLTVQSTASTRELSLILYTADGKIARAASMYALEETMNVSDLAAGVYFLHVNSGQERVQTFKVVKQD